MHFDLASIERQLEELRGDMSSPGFWDDVDRANEINKKIRNLESKAESFKKLNARADDAEVLMELAFEHNDAESQELLEGELDELMELADEFRLTTVLQGKYDANNAILSLHAGAGGTEAQDWVQMLYRMYTRYCERKGYTVKVLDFLPGEEAGIKNVTFLVEGDNAYGFLKAEKGVHRLVRISPFDANARRHTSFASLDVMPEVDDADAIEIRPGGHQGGHLPLLRRGRPARQQDGVRRAHHAHPHRLRRRLPERALAGAEQGSRDAHADEQARGEAGAGAPRGDGAREGRGQEESSGAARYAPTSSARTRWSRTTARTPRRPTWTP